MAVPRDCSLCCVSSQPFDFPDRVFFLFLTHVLVEFEMLKHGRPWRMQRYAPRKAGGEAELKTITAQLWEVKDPQSKEDLPWGMPSNNYDAACSAL